MPSYQPPTRVFGISLSADAGRAGEETWIAAVSADGDPTVVDCSPVVEGLDSEPGREEALPELTTFLADLEGTAAAGLDVPFGLPAAVVAAGAWTEVLRRLPGWADDPMDLVRESEARATTDGGEAELRRETAEPLGTSTPFDQRQRARTYYALRDVLRPLALADAARALPMQPLSRSHPHLLEVFPAGTLARLGCADRPYRGTNDADRQRRAATIDDVDEAGLAVVDSARQRVVGDVSGRALEAVVAALATYQHTLDPTDLRTADPTRQVEGHIYV